MSKYKVQMSGLTPANEHVHTWGLDLPRDSFTADVHLYFSIRHLQLNLFVLTSFLITAGPEL